MLVMRPACSSAFPLQSLLQVHFRVPFLLVGPRKLAPAHIARERLLARVRPHVRRQVIRPTERPHANTALERLLSRVYPDVPRQFVRPREASVAPVHGTSVWALVDGSLARSIGVLSRFDGDEPQRLGALLVDLGEDLVALARGGVVFCELYGAVAAAGRARVWLSLGQAGGSGRGLGLMSVLLVPGVVGLWLGRGAVLAVLRRGAGLLRRAVSLAVWRGQQLDALLVLLLDVK